MRRLVKKEAIINNSNLYENKCLLLEKQNKELTKIVEDLIKKVSKLEKNNNKKQIKITIIIIHLILSKIIR